MAERRAYIAASTDAAGTAAGDFCLGRDLGSVGFLSASAGRAL